MWLEEDRLDQWRGHITHVPDGERHYLKSIEEIPAFIRRYLGINDVRTRSFGRLKRWLSSGR
jgi:hypothetical protein